MDEQQINKIYVIIGAGPAGLMAAQKLAEAGKKVSIYEQKNAAARKFLVAGHGGFNLTHTDDYSEMMLEYTPKVLLSFIEDFSNLDTIDWLSKIGIPTFKGSSGKLFPQKGIKPIEVLQAWLLYLNKLGVKFFYRHKMLDFDNEKVLITHSDQSFFVPFEKLILSLGGVSWPQTGSDGNWINLFLEKDIAVQTFQAANSGLNTTKNFTHLEGQVLKNVKLKCNEIEKVGELLFSYYGIEGSLVYYLNRTLRKNNFPQTIFLDLKPTYTKQALIEKINKTKHNNNISSILKSDLAIKGPSLALLKMLDKESFTNIETLVAFIKEYPIEVTGFRAIEEVISSAGGVAWHAISNDLSLHLFPNVHCVGEMLDWEAPTGGYLLQGCFATGNFVGTTIVNKTINKL